MGAVVFGSAGAAFSVLSGCHDRTVGMDSEQLLEIEELRVGLGAAATTGDEVNVRYRCELPDGTPIKQLDLFEQGKSHRFRIGDGTVIAGVNDGILGMKPGGRRRVTVPPLLHWGDGGYGGVIPPDAALVFEIELLALYE